MNWHWEHTVGALKISVLWAVVFIIVLAIPVNVEPITEYVQLPAPPPEIIYERVEAPVEVVKEVEVIKEVVKWRTIFDREFESVKHFKEWYAAQNFKPLFPSPDHLVDCDDYAQRVQITALRQGYAVSVALVMNGVYYGKGVTDVPNGHAGILIQIKGTYYYAEPEPGEIELVKVTNRD